MMINRNLQPKTLLALLCCALAFGCAVEDASEVVQQVEESASETAETVQESASDAAESLEEQVAETAETVQEEATEAVEQTQQAAEALSERAQEFMGPLREKFSSLESLRDNPQELKEAVAGLIAMLEERAADLQLPEGMQGALETAKEKLAALKEYLEGEVEQAQVDEHLEEIMDSIRPHLVSSDEE